MPQAQTYQSEFTGQEMDARFAAVAQLTAALEALTTVVAQKYVKPASGIPSTDMDADVQAALAKANTAVQSLADYYTKSEVDQLLAAINGMDYVDVATLPTASAETLGKIYLVGPDASGYYSYYYTSYDGSDYSWVGPLGTTEISMANYATKAELSQLDQKVKALANMDITHYWLGVSHTFSNSNSYSSLFIPVSGGVPFSIEGNDENTIYCFLKSLPTPTALSADYATGSTRTRLHQNEKVTGMTPSDARYIFVTKSSGDTSWLPKRLVVEGWDYTLGTNVSMTQHLGSIQTSINVIDSELVEKYSRLDAKIEIIQIDLTENKSIAIGGTIGATIPMQQTTESGWKSAIVPCVPGDVFRISGKGGQNTRLWGFVNSNAVLLSVSNAGITETDLELEAPENAAYLLLNTNNSANSYKLASSSSDYKIEKINANIIYSDVSNIGDNAGYYIRYSDGEKVGQSSYHYSSPVQMKRGERLFFRTRIADTVAAISLCDSLGANITPVVKGAGIASFHSYDYVATADCYVILCWTFINRLQLTSIPAIAPLLIDTTVFSVDSNSRLQNIPATPLALIKQTPGYAAAIRTWGFVGDSLASGEIWGYKNGESWHTDNYDISWGQYMLRAMGAEGKNYSVGGQTAKWWVNNYLSPSDRSLAGVQADGGKQAYIIGLGVNDAAQLNTLYSSGVATDLSDIADDIDMSTPSNNADSFAGWYARVIQEILAVSPDSLIFIVTVPQEIDSDWEDVNTVIRAMPSIFSADFPNQIWLIDLIENLPSGGDYWKAFKTNGAHLNAQGYLYFAWVMMTYIDWLIGKNMEAFKGLCFIGTEAQINP